MQLGFHLLKRRWIKVVGAATVGVSVGIAAAALSAHHARLSEVDTPGGATPYVVPVASHVSNAPIALGVMPPTAHELERLETRNRRLEALVAVLRHRATERRQSE